MVTRAQGETACQETRDLAWSDMPVAHSTINPPLPATSLRRSAEFSVPRQRPRFSIEVLAAAAAVVDFCLVAAATTGGLLYFQLRNDPSAGAQRYGLAWIFAATLFVIAFDRLGGYRFTRLRQLRWQLLHVPMVWAAPRSGIAARSVCLQNVGYLFARLGAGVGRHHPVTTID